MIEYFLIVLMSVDGGEEDVEAGLVEGTDEGINVGSEVGDNVAVVAFGYEIGPL